MVNLFRRTPEPVRWFMFVCVVGVITIPFLRPSGVEILGDLIGTVIVAAIIATAVHLRFRSKRKQD